MVTRSGRMAPTWPSSERHDPQRSAGGLRLQGPDRRRGRRHRAVKVSPASPEPPDLHPDPSASSACVVLRWLRRSLGNDLVAEHYAPIADIDTRPGNELLHLFLGFSTERASCLAPTIMPIHAQKSTASVLIGG